MSVCCQGNMNPSIYASEILASFRVFRGQMDFQAVEAWQPLAMVQLIYRFKIDALSVRDDFVPIVG